MTESYVQPFSSVRPPVDARLAAVSNGGAVDEAALIALAALDPRAAAQWLIRQADAGPGAVRPRRLARVLELIAESVGASSGAIEKSELTAVLRHYGHLLAPSAAADLAMAALDTAAEGSLVEALQVALERAPANAGLLRSAAELAAATGQTARAHDLLTRLGRADASLATMQFVRRTRAKLPRTGQQTIRIALASSFTVDQLVPFLDLECRSLRLEPELYVSPFNTWEREMLGDGSGLQAFAPQVVFLAVAADDLMPGVSASAAELESAGAAAVERLLASAARFTSWSPALLVVHGLHSAFLDPLGPAAGRDGQSRGEIIAAMNARLADGLRTIPRAYYLDLPDVLARRRQGALDNPKMRHVASMRIGENALAAVAAAHAQFIAPVAGRTRKCVVLDLDNTLWGGIVGEDGPHGIRLGNTSPGSEFREFQQYLHALTRRGILLAVNSKNNAADALEVIRTHDAMVLREDSFSAIRINWESKASNMASIAEELNLGLDAFVFVDDSDKERALMRQTLPQVLTPEMPRDPSRYLETLDALPELQVLTVTDEDRGRARQYIERRQREQIRVSAQTPADYLGSLGIETAMAVVSERTLPRVHQLFQRTNQFNLTGRRYELGALTARAAEPGSRIFTSHVIDRFGDHGLVATALVAVAPERWSIENFVMSCRVIGYGVEDALLARIIEDARAAGAHWVTGEFIPTPKNAPARDFYARHGFVRDDSETPAESYRRDIRDAGMETPAWITVRSGNGA
jgi:FkbH-like protein